MSSTRKSLADQLKELQDPAPRSTPLTLDRTDRPAQDPEDAYSSLDGLQISHKEGDEGREHYLEVGKSRMGAGAGQGGRMAQTLLSDKYGGKKTSRVKIFEDDEDEEDESEHDGASGSGEEDDDGEDEDEDEDEDERDQEEDEEEDEDEEEEDEAEDDTQQAPASSSKSLDPLAHLHASRAKDIEKGQAIRRQQRLFENTLTLRITFQKALTSAQKIPRARSASQLDEQESSARAGALTSLAELSERLFALRSGLLLPGTDAPPSKRRKLSDTAAEAQQESYWQSAAHDSLSLVDASHANVSSVLAKWSAKIHAATVSGKSKFSASEGGTSVIEAIEAGLASKREADRAFIDSEEAGYRALLREVIESRTGQSSAVDLTHLRKEKKKKREAERGGSKGRKLRYTVHEKAQSFMVPIPLQGAWHDEQVDELFGSLFGGAKVVGGDDQAQPRASAQGLGGLRMLG